MHTQQTAQALERSVVGFSKLLCISARYGYEHIIPQLIQGGALVNYRVKHGMTPLWLAARTGHTRVAELLIRNGAEVNCARDNGETALMMAAYCGDTKTAELLIKQGANINYADNSGNTALYHAALQKFAGDSENDYEQDYIGTIKLLISKGTEIDKAAAFTSPLGAAAFKHDTEVVRLLIDAGANVNHVLDQGQTPLIRAVQNNNIEITKLLIDAGAEVNHTDVDGMTALASASFYRFTDIVELLINQGANVNYTDYCGYTPLMHAIISDQDFPAVRMVCPPEGYKDIVELLITRGANLELSSDDGKTALMLAVSGCEIEIAELLISKGAKVDYAIKNGKTALMHASISGNAKGIEFLIAKGAKVDYANKNGITALMHASINGNATAVRLLIASGASVNKTDKENMTALMHTSSASHPEIKKVLKLAGAPGDIVKAGDDACYPSEDEALGALECFFGQRLQSILRPLMTSLFTSVNTLLLVHVRLKNTDVNNNDSSLPALSLELWYQITRLIPLLFANGVLKYGYSADHSTSVSNAEICPHVDFSLTSSNVCKIKYGAGLKSQNLTKKDLGVDTEILMRSIV